MRRALPERMSQLQAQKQRIEAQLQALAAKEKEASRRIDTRRKIIIGAAVLAHAEIDSSFAEALRAALNLAVIRPGDREMIGDLLVTPANDTGR